MKAIESAPKDGTRILLYDPNTEQFYTGYWNFSMGNGEYFIGYEWHEVGKNGCKDIFEYPAMGEGDKWHYDVIYDDGKIERIFNVSKAYLS